MQALRIAPPRKFTGEPIYEQKKDYKSALEWYERYLALGKPGTKAYRFVEESVRYLKAEKFMTQE